MKYSNKITFMCTMALVLLVGYSLNGISGMNFQDRMAYATLVESKIDNQSNQKFTLQKVTKEHFKLENTVPQTLEPGKSYTIKGDATSTIHDGIIHLYYTYGKNYTAEFSSWFDPLGFPEKCSDESGSSEIHISCASAHEDSWFQFTIKNAN